MLELSDEYDKAIVDDGGSGPVLSRRRRGHNELLDAVDEAGERLDVTGWPESGPVVVGWRPRSTAS
jgi:hypothetical protein